MTTTAQIKQKLLDHIIQKVLNNTELPIAYDTELLSGGIISSLNIVDIVVFIENEFAVIVPDSDLTLENVDTVNALTELTLQHLESSS